MCECMRGGLIDSCPWVAEISALRSAAQCVWPIHLSVYAGCGQCDAVHVSLMVAVQGPRNTAHSSV
jgi:hypothetical protein